MTKPKSLPKKNVSYRKLIALTILILFFGAPFLFLSRNKKEYLATKSDLLFNVSSDLFKNNKVMGAKLGSKDTAILILKDNIGWTYYLRDTSCSKYDFPLIFTFKFEDARLLVSTLIVNKTHHIILEIHENKLVRKSPEIKMTHGDNITYFEALDSQNRIAFSLQIKANIMFLQGYFIGSRCTLVLATGYRDCFSNDDPNYDKRLAEGCKQIKPITEF